MIRKHRFLCVALPAAWALLSSCAAPRGAASAAMPSQAAFKSDFRLPLDASLWEAEPKAQAGGLCGSDPALLETTPDGLRLSILNQNWYPNGCAYGSLWSRRTLGYGTVTALLKVPIHSGETTEFLLLGDALSKDGPQKAMELRFFGKDPGGVQLRTLWDARAGERGGGVSKWVPL
ncbi:MAG TPA: hypothetical protein VK786_06425, partial [bacterium]|nr:hypothetical protein [bacterium]